MLPLFHIWPSQYLFSPLHLLLLQFLITIIVNICFVQRLPCAHLFWLPLQIKEITSTFLEYVLINNFSRIYSSYKQIISLISQNCLHSKMNVILTRIELLPIIQATHVNDLADEAIKKFWRGVIYSSSETRFISVF